MTPQESAGLKVVLGLTLLLVAVAGPLVVRWIDESFGEPKDEGSVKEGWKRREGR